MSHPVDDYYSFYDDSWEVFAITEELVSEGLLSE